MIIIGPVRFDPRWHGDELFLSAGCCLMVVLLFFCVFLTSASLKLKAERWCVGCESWSDSRRWWRGCVLEVKVTGLLWFSLKFADRKWDDVTSWSVQSVCPGRVKRQQKYLNCRTRRFSIQTKTNPVSRRGCDCRQDNCVCGSSAGETRVKHSLLNSVWNMTAGNINMNNEQQSLAC